MSRLATTATPARRSVKRPPGRRGRHQCSAFVREPDVPTQFAAATDAAWLGVTIPR